MRCLPFTVRTNTDRAKLVSEAAGSRFSGRVDEDEANGDPDEEEREGGCGVKYSSNFQLSERVAQDAKCRTEPSAPCCCC